MYEVRDVGETLDANCLAERLKLLSVGLAFGAKEVELGKVDVDFAAGFLKPLVRGKEGRRDGVGPVGLVRQVLFPVYMSAKLTRDRDGVLTPEHLVFW